MMKAFPKHWWHLVTYQIEPLVTVQGGPLLGINGIMGPSIMALKMGSWGYNPTYNHEWSGGTPRLCSLCSWICWRWFFSFQGKSPSNQHLGKYFLDFFQACYASPGDNPIIFIYIYIYVKPYLKPRKHIDSVKTAWHESSFRILKKPSCTINIFHIFSELFGKSCCDWILWKKQLLSRG